jgi:hypothetical protein
MMKKIILLVINLLVLTNTYSINKQDSIYHDLYLFLVSKGDMDKEQIPTLESNNYGEYLYLFNILKDEFPNKPDLDTPFGIYKFNYAGYADGGYYVLIKYNESYKVYNQNSLSLIIKEFMRIKKDNPDLINDNLFYQYLEEIVKDNLGIYDDKIILVQTIGNIEYYR